MRGDMEEAFGDVLGRRGLSGGRAGFSPAVDVYYCGEPARAVITVELAGADADSLEVEVNGREVVIWGQRPPPRPRTASTSSWRSRTAPSGGW